MVEFLGIKTVITPPAVYIPNDKGVTSINNKLSVCYDPVPDRMAACTAAP